MIQLQVLTARVEPERFVLHSNLQSPCQVTRNQNEKGYLVLSLKLLPVAKYPYKEPIMKMEKYGVVIQVINLLTKTLGKPRPDSSPSIKDQLTMS